MNRLFQTITLAAALATSNVQSAGEETGGLKNKKAAAVLAALEAVKAGTPAGKSTVNVDALIKLASDGNISPEDEVAITSFGSTLHRAGNPQDANKRPLGKQNLFELNDELAILAAAIATKEETTPPASPVNQGNNQLGEEADAQKDIQQDEKPKDVAVKPKIIPGSKEDLALKRAAAEAKTAKEKAYKMALSSAKTLHTDFLESKNWKPDPGNKLKFATKPGKGIKLEGDAKDIEVTHEAKIDFTTKLAPGIYNITIPSNVDANSVSLYLRANSDQPIGMDGNPVQAGKSKCAANFESGKKVRISIPDNCKITHFQVTLSGKNKVFHTDDIIVEAVGEENLVANQ